jgi:hypothetical protein
MSAIMALALVISFVCVGTLNQGYPLPQYEDAVHVQFLQATRGITPDPTTWAGLKALCGKERQYTHGCIIRPGPLQRDTGPLYMQV